MTTKTHFVWTICRCKILTERTHATEVLGSYLLGYTDLDA